MLDYDEVERLAKQHAPTLIVAGATAYPRTIDFGRFRAIANEVGASLMVDMAHPAGIIAAGLHPSPVPHADVITSSTHKTLRGPRGGMILTNSKLKGAIDKAVFPRLQGGPLMHVIAAKAVAFGEALNPNFRGYQERVINNAKALAEVLKENGFRVISKGTDTHLVLIDLTSAGVTGQEAETLLESVHITVNKNAIPFDTQPPRVTSGLRLGTPATTTRGFGLEEVRKTGELIARAIKGRNRDQTLREVRSEAEALASSFPLPGIDDSI
jgi:glycine hydroxymethyltransferase